jgi:hypothetical protein
MLRHQGAILRGFIKKKNHKSNTYLGASGNCPLYVFDREMEAQTDGLDREIVVTIQRVQNIVNSFVEMLLQAGEFIRNQEVLNVQLASPRSW